MTGGLETEQAELISRLAEMEVEFNRKKLTASDLTEWVSKVKSCLQIDTLTRAIVMELIDCITVSKGEEGYNISIQYRFAGNPCDREKNRANPLK
jgi:hypothetical protein